MEEREALKRQIELLQNLIDNHKSIHGDIPSGRVQQRTVEASTSASGHSSSFVHPYSSRMRLNTPQSCASWRKTYSLKNKNPQSSVGNPSHASFTDCSTVHIHSRGEDSVKIASLSSGVSHQRKKEDTKSIVQTRGVETEKQNTDTLALSEHGSKKGTPGVQHKAFPKQTQECYHKAKEKHVVVPEKKVCVSLEALTSVKASTSASLKSSQQLQAKVSPRGEISTETKRTISPSTATGITVLPPATPPKVSKQSSGDLTSRSSHCQVGTSSLKSSKFTWVKSQNVGGAEQRQASGMLSSPVKALTASAASVSKVEVSSGSFPTASLSKRTPAKKSIRKLSPVAVAHKTSKYKWVSSSAGAQAKISRKSVLPKSPTLLPIRAMEKVETSRKARTALTSTVKIRKEIVPSRATPSLSNRYRWKAGGQNTPAAMTAGATVSQRRSTIWHWTSGKNNKGLRGGHVTSLSLAQRTSHLPSSSPGAFKLRSKMKIIRKSVSSGGGSEKGTSPSALKLSQRSRPHSSSRSPIGVRKTKLVSFGRHKLRRLSTSLSKTRPASTSTEFGSRYKTRLGSSLAHTHLYNPALSWRAKRIQSARCFLQSRQSLRMLNYKQPPPMQRWKGSSMCWIRGSLYRVSANKLSRTVASSMSINRTERSFSSTHASPMTPVLNQPSTTRHLASRAVQRSLAIIRQAHQKKQPKQYCIYYNRFGKCNRGTSCPFIHDPDKVAVCTRFLRGTCKQADGTCPFSHKVAKEKMPVCSYFLKGICNNSDCPYSHVYVSHKAKVCDDFVKGYCPEGEKCKKKHTLVCPDFSKTGSCPQGARCKLQHRRAAKRNASSTSATPAKRARTKESCKRPQLPFVILEGSQAAPETPSKGPLELPSFISLSSSPEEADAPDTPLADSTKVKEKKLQIKPRL